MARRDDRSRRDGVQRVADLAGGLVDQDSAEAAETPQDSADVVPSVRHESAGLSRHDRRSAVLQIDDSRRRKGLAADVADQK